MERADFLCDCVSAWPHSAVRVCLDMWRAHSMQMNESPSLLVPGARAQHGEQANENSALAHNSSTRSPGQFGGPTPKAFDFSLWDPNRQSTLLGIPR